MSITQTSDGDCILDFSDAMTHDECVEHFLSMTHGEFKAAMNTLVMIADAFNEAANLRRYCGGQEGY